jgi:uncharacterized protein (DUF2384 family)
MEIDHKLVTAATSLFEGDTLSAKEWLLKPQPALGGISPAEAPLAQALEFIEKLEHGIFI